MKIFFSSRKILFKHKQSGFSLLEVLVAMLIAAVVVGGTMFIHTQNLSQVSQTAELNRAQLVLSNMAHRMQANTTGLIENAYILNNAPAMVQINPVCAIPCSAANRATTFDIPIWQNQVFEANLKNASLSIANQTSINGSWLLTIQWDAHIANGTEAVWRTLCGSNPVKGRNCVAMQVTP